MTAGSLTLASPIAIGWTEIMNGVDQVLADPATAHQSYVVNDATGSAAGWNVTVSATTFATTATTPLILGTSGALTPTFSTNGSTALTAGAITNAAPGAQCAGTSTCTLPTNTLAASYPVTITTANAATGSTPVTIYDTAAGTGLGTIVIGYDGVVVTNPIGWWINVPSNTVQGTYISTVTLQLNSAP